MTTLATPLRRSAAALALCLGSLAAHAATTPWVTLGDTVQNAGTLTLSTAYTDGDDAPFNLSGTAAADVGALESALGLPAYALDLTLPGQDPLPAYEGSLGMTSFSAAAGSTVSISWSLTSADTLFPDQVFLQLDNRFITLAHALQAPTGTLTSTYTLDSDGLHTLFIGVVDNGDYIGVSTLTVSNVQVSAVPEPGSWALLLAGAGVLGVRARRRQR